MLYFDNHPIFSYSFLDQTKSYEFIDLFRRNFVEIDPLLLSTNIVRPNDTLEHNAKGIYGDESMSWVLSVINNYYSRDLVASLNQNIKITNKKVYSILDIIDIKFGDLIIDHNDFAGFSKAVDPFVFVSNWDALMRSMIITDNTESSFIENTRIDILRFDALQGALERITGTEGITLEKITDVETFPIRFTTNNITISPYLNVSGVTGNTYMPINATGASFGNTLLYSYITDGLSHSNYDTETKETKFREVANTNISINFVNRTIVAEIEKEFEKTLSDTNKSRAFNIQIV